MSTLTSKEQIIHDVYYDDSDGFGSLRHTYNLANEKDNTIKYSDVEGYLYTLEHRQTQFKYTGFNSFISPHALFEFEIDLIDMTKSAKENNGYRFALTAIDNFSKYGSTIPMKGKTPKFIVAAFTEVMKDIGIPKQIYSDDEGSFSSKQFIRLMNENKIKHIISSTGAPTVERFNRTIKSKTIMRLNAMGLKRFEWTNQIESVMKQYNNTESTTTKLSPIEARRPGNELFVSFNLQQNATFSRNYEELIVGDNVRVKMKKEKGTKGYDPKWSKVVYKITFIKGGDYLINHPTKRHVYLRHEILLVK
jgi:transposase InsO family protein